MLPASGHAPSKVCKRSQRQIDWTMRWRAVGASPSGAVRTNSLLMDGGHMSRVPEPCHLPMLSCSWICSPRAMMSRRLPATLSSANFMGLFKVEDFLARFSVRIIAIPPFIPKNYNEIRHEMKPSSPACHQFWVLALCPCLFSLPVVQLRPKRLVHQTWLQWLMLKALDALERVILHQVNWASRPPNPPSDPYCCSWNTLSTTLSSSIFQSSKMQYGLF